MERSRQSELGNGKPKSSHLLHRNFPHNPRPRESRQQESKLHPFLINTVHIAWVERRLLNSYECLDNFFLSKMQKCKNYSNNLLTESEGFTRKYQTEALLRVSFLLYGWHMWVSKWVQTTYTNEPNYYTVLR